MDSDFQDLQVGDPVQFDLERGDEGQDVAKNVRILAAYLQTLSLIKKATPYRCGFFAAGRNVNAKAIKKANLSDGLFLMILMD
jgi:hypothetical protein